MSLTEKMAEIETRLDTLRGIRVTLLGFYKAEDETYWRFAEDEKQMNQPSFGAPDGERDEARRRELEKNLADSWAKRTAYAECVTAVDNNLRKLLNEKQNTDLGLAFGEFKPSLPESAAEEQAGGATK